MSSASQAAKQMQSASSKRAFASCSNASRTLRSSAPSRSPTSATIFPNTNARFAAVSAVLHEEARKPPPAGNLDALVNKYLAAFRNVDQLLGAGPSANSNLSRTLSGVGRLSARGDA